MIGSIRFTTVVVALIAFTACGSQTAARGTLSSSPTPTAITSPPPTAQAAAALQPVGVAFWNDTSGLLVESVDTSACATDVGTCRSVIERTADGGRTWELVERAPGSLNAVEVAGTDVAWATGPFCYLGSCTGATTILVTSDGGQSWRETTPDAPVTSVSPVSATSAWAVGLNNTAPAGNTLLQSGDGGHIWHAQADPCQMVGGGALDLWAVKFSGPTQGAAICTSGPATDMQGKAVLVTSDGGSTWYLRSATCLFGQPENVGTLSCVGYLPGVQLLADGHGWLWSAREGLASTDDGGRIWTQIAVNYVYDDINEVASASFVDDRDGFMLVTPRPESNAACPADGCGPQLLSTHNAGQSWMAVQTWGP